MRRHALTWNPGEVTMIVGITYFVLILCSGVILGKPEPGIEISFGVGWFVGLWASLGMMVGGFVRQASTRGCASLRECSSPSPSERRSQLARREGHRPP